jgi:glycosyltransferase involved in cell wall biosynthesis
MKHDNRISLIIPTLNEEKNLPFILKKIPYFIDEIVVVDGFSKDHTVDIAKKYGCKVIFDNYGKGSALILGAKKSTGDYLVMMDADCSNRTRELKSLIDGLEQGNDICMGSRFLPGGGSQDLTTIRKLGNKFFVLLVNLFYGSNYTDLCYGYRSMTKDAFHSLNLTSKGFSIETEMSIRAAKKRMKILEVPSQEKERRSGESKLRTFSDGWKIMRKIIEEFSRDD